MLDERKPGWWEKVNPLTLNIGSSDNCVLGQLYGSYWPGRQALIENKEEFTWSANHGFAASATFDNYGQRIDSLNSEWRAVIEERQREAKAKERLADLNHAIYVDQYC
jgi:hypothetical protein